MSLENARDVRARLVETKYFTLRPKPLEQWIWQKRLSANAERLFWLHWDEGMRNGTWCSEVALSRAAGTLGVDVSTVTRAYQTLMRCELIRRTNPGHDPHNPFQQAITITEVLLPRELVDVLERFPNRSQKSAVTSVQVVPAAPKVEVAAENSPASVPTVKFDAKELSDAMNRMSEEEKVRFFQATRRCEAMTFDANTRLLPDQVALLQTHVASYAKTATRTQRELPAAKTIRPAGLRRVTPHDGARLRARLHQLKNFAEADELFRQCLWSIERGALMKFDVPMAINVAVKMVREDRWGRPNQMPPNWMLGRASPELCAVA